MRYNFNVSGGITPQEAARQIVYDELCRRSYIDYCAMVHNGAWIPAEHHRLIADKLQAVAEGDIKRLMVWMPPRHGKSMEITETFPSWFLGRNPDKRVIEVSYGAEFAEKFGRANRAKIQEHGKRLFGVSVSGAKSSATNWDLDGYRGGMLSVGIGGSITGQGADLLIIDDPVKNREEADSETYRNKIWDEYRSTIYTRLHPGAAIIIVMTRWHEDDLCGRILADDPDGWEILSLPALAEANDPLGRDAGEPLWPEHGYDAHWANDTRRTVGSYAWAALYQQRPSPEEGGLLKRNWWRFYKELPEMLDTIISVDAAFKDTSDFVSIQAWGKRGADMYLLDKDTRRIDFPETVKAIEAMYAEYPAASAVYIEDKANGSAIISTLRDKIPIIVPINPQGGKIARANAISAAIESGHVYLPAGMVISDELIEQCAAFPNGAHDDDVDAMTQALNRFIYHWAEPETVRHTVKWHDDQYEDYYRATPEQQALLLTRWGNPF